MKGGLGAVRESLPGVGPVPAIGRAWHGCYCREDGGFCKKKKKKHDATITPCGEGTARAKFVSKWLEMCGGLKAL